MPLIEVECLAGHRSEILKRGASNTGPFACPECGEDAARRYSTFGITVREYGYVPPPKDPNNRLKPEFINRMGDGKIAKDGDNLYRPALTHNTKCPKEGKWRNVAILNDLNFARRLVCEGCGYTWLYRAETAADPLFNTVVEAYRPGKNFSRDVPAGTGYEQPKRGA